MSSVAYYSSLNIQNILNSPSAKSFQWSPDGQACFVTKTAVYIITPEPGINHDHFSLLPPILQGATLPSISSNETDPASQLTVNWFRTMIQYDLKSPDVMRWPDFSQELCAASLGSIDVSIWQFTFSPSGVGPNAECIVAILTSNMDLSLWRATKNALKGEWIKILDIPVILLDKYEANSSNLWQTLCSQVVCVQWSSQADFDLQPAPHIDSSLLVCGTRAGTLIFMRFNPSNSTVEIIETLYLSKEWITQISVSSWVAIEAGKCKATVAYSTSLGKVGIVQVTQSLIRENIRPPARIECLFEHASATNVAQKLIGITTLKWIEVPNRNPILVFATPGILRVWSSPPASEAETTWSGTKSFILKTHKIHVGSSSMHPVVGIEYLPTKDMLLVCLLDGSNHIINSLSTTPVLDERVGEQLTRNCRKIFEQLEYAQQVRVVPIAEEKREKDREDKEKKETRMTKSHANTTAGFGSYDDNGVMVWLHEPTRPADFSYKHDAKHNCMFVVARVMEEISDDDFLECIRQRLAGCKAARNLSPLNILRPILFHMRHKARLVRIHPQIIETIAMHQSDLKVMEDEDELLSWVDVENGTVSDNVKKEFRSSLRTYLFGFDVLMSLRMRLSLADYGWKLNDDPKCRMEYGAVAEGLLVTISHRNLRTLLQHLIAVAPAFTVDDVPFVLRMVIQALLPGAPADIAAEGENISTVVHAMFEEHSAVGLQELCPACGVQIPLENIINAKCSNGHVWSRCSVTTFILSTPDVRTCIGCTRKAFLPLSMHQSKSKVELRGWFVEELLEAVHRCLFCGNNFVNVL